MILEVDKTCEVSLPLVTEAFQAQWNFLASKNTIIIELSFVLIAYNIVTS